MEKLNGSWISLHWFLWLTYWLPLPFPDLCHASKPATLYLWFPKWGAGIAACIPLYCIRKNPYRNWLAKHLLFWASLAWRSQTAEGIQKLLEVRKNTGGWTLWTSFVVFSGQVWVSSKPRGCCVGQYWGLKHQPSSQESNQICYGQPLGWELKETHCFKLNLKRKWKYHKQLCLFSPFLPKEPKHSPAHEEGESGGFSHNRKSIFHQHQQAGYACLRAVGWTSPCLAASLLCTLR